MDDLRQSIDQLKQLRENILSELPAVATAVSMAGKALAERTIKDKGFGKLYSEKKVPAWFMKGKELNASGASYISGLIKKGTEQKPALTNWKEFRSVQGLQTDHVDLTYSGKMWAGMFPQEPVLAGYKIIAPLGNNTIEGRDKMNYNFSRYGDFIGATLTGDNADKMREVVASEMARIMSGALNWKNE